MAKTRNANSAQTDAQTWQQTKSQRTRSTLLEAALQCFYDIGYYHTTTEKIAREAGVSRGAMLHHFPSRRELIQAAVLHLNDKRLAAYEHEERELQEQQRYTHIEQGIDIYWRQLNSWLFVVFHELRVASRTDPELRRILIPALEAFDQASVETTRRLFPDLALSEHFELACNLTLFLLEGLAVNRDARRPVDRQRRQVLDYLKRQLRELFSDVHERVDREAATQRTETGT